MYTSFLEIDCWVNACETFLSILIFTVKFCSKRSQSLILPPIVHEFPFPTLSSMEVNSLSMFSNYIGNSVSLDGSIFKLSIIVNFTYAQDYYYSLPIILIQQLPTYRHICFRCTTLNPFLRFPAIPHLLGSFFSLPLVIHLLLLILVLLLTSSKILLFGLKATYL